MQKQQPSQLSTADRSYNNPPQEIEDSLTTELQFGFQVPTNFILELFQEVAQTTYLQSQIRDFEMIEKEASHATAIKQGKKSFLQMIDCFSLVTNENMTAIKLTIHTNEKTSKRICKVRGLVGSKRQVKQFISLFKQKSRQLIKVQNSFYPQQQQEDSQNLQNPFHLEACAIYMFHKILSNQSYSIGALLKTSLANYKEKFSSVQGAAKQLPLPMRQLIVLIQDIIDQLYKDFNYGKKEMEKVMPYCRVSVEKYVFSQVENIIGPVYHFAWSQVDNVVEEKRKKIFANYSLAEIFDQVGLPKDLWFISSGTNVQEVRPLKHWKSLIKYYPASQQLQKLPHSKTPRQKLKQCQISYTVLKTIFYEQSQRKRQLTNMEDIIPVLIVVILLSQMQGLKGELQMVLDWIEADPGEMDAEKRLIINLNESMNFVFRDWKV